MTISLPREPRRLRGAQHRERLADAGRRAEENPQPAAPRTRLLGLDLREQLVGIGPRLDCHQGVIIAAARASSARFSVEHVDARLAEHAERAALRVLADERLDFARGQIAARARRARSGIRAAATLMCGIEPAARRRDEIDGHGRLVAGIGCAQRRDALRYRLGQRGTQRALVRAARHGAVVRHRPRRRRPAPEVLRRGERLAEQPRADGRPSRSMTLPVDLARERELPDRA